MPRTNTGYKLETVSQTIIAHSPNTQSGDIPVRIGNGPKGHITIQIGTSRIAIVNMKELGEAIKAVKDGSDGATG